MKYYSNLLISSLLLLLAGCVSSKPPMDFSQQPPPSFETVKIELADEASVVVQIQDTVSASGGGLIPALIAAGIDSNINEKRMKKGEIDIANVRESFVGYDFDTIAEAELTEAMAGLSVFDGAVISQGSMFKEGQTTIDTKEIPDNVLFLSMGYSFSHQFSHVSVNLSLNYKQGEDFWNRNYRFIDQMSEQLNYGYRDTNIEAIKGSINDVESEILTGIGEVVAMFRNDFSGNYPMHTEGVEKISDTDGTYPITNATIISVNDRRTIAHSADFGGNATFYSLSKSMILE